MDHFEIDKINKLILTKHHLTKDSKTDNILRITEDLCGLHGTGTIEPYLSLFARMNLFKKAIYTKLNKIIQGETARNKAAVKCLKELGFPMKRIRKSLLELNEIHIPSLSNGVSNACVYNTLSGLRKNEKAMRILASSVGLEVEELFPEN